MFVCFVNKESSPEIVASGTDTNVEAEEGNFATLKCIAIGNPTPSVVWQKNTTLVSNTVDLYNNVVTHCMPTQTSREPQFQMVSVTRFWATGYF